MRMSVGLCMTVREPAGRVARIVESVRPHVDEVVVAVDSRGDPATGDALKGLADRVLWFESPGFGAALIAWALRQCSADWILRLDDDEIPSRALLDTLPRLCADREVTHVSFERRWLFPDASRYISVHPWLPDYQTRLVRNVPGIWRAGGQVHEPHEVLGAGRMMPLALYHADLLLRDREERRRKADRYERARPGVRLEDFPTNAVYLPEDAAGVETTPVPAGDAALVEALCAPAAMSGAPPPAPGDVVPAAELLRHSAAAEPGEEAYVGSVSFPRPRRALPAGMAARIEVDVTNRSPLPWPSAQAADSPVRLGHRWISPDGQPQPDGPRAPLTASVEAGATERLLMDVEVPGDPGPWTLEADLLHEGVSWFNSPERIEIEVVPPYWASRPGPRRRGLFRRRGATEPGQARPLAFHGSFGLDGIDLRLVERLGGLRDGVFVEAGANDGVSQSNTLLLEAAYGWQGLLVEPVPRLAAAARANRPNTAVEEVALVAPGAEGQTVEMVDVGLMSLLRGTFGSHEADAAHVADGRRRAGVEPRPLHVRGAALSTVLDRHQLRHVDLLVLDVEGHEPAVLEGLDPERHVVDWALVEARDRVAVEAVLGDRYEPVAELSHHDVLYRRVR